MLAKLPNEVLEHIMFYCKAEDKCATARCSKHFNTIMEPFMWEEVCIPSNLLTKRWNDDNLFIKFRHVKKMKICFNVPRLRTTRRHAARPKAYKRIKRNLAKILDNIQPFRLSEAIVDICASTESLTSENFIQIMEKLTLLKRLDLIGLKLTEQAWKSIPNGLVHLGVNGGHSFRAYCNITDKAFKEILERSHQLSSIECELDLFQKGLSEDSLHHISKVENITKLKIKFYVPPPLNLRWIVNLRNLKNLDLRGKVFPVEGNEIVFQICQNLPQLETLTLGGLKLVDGCFSEIHLLSSLTKLSIYKMSCLFGCRIFQYIKNIHTLRELSFDGYTFPKLVDIYETGCMLSDQRRDDLLKDIAFLNELPNLRKIEIFCAAHFDISPIIVKGLCKEKKWIHKYEDNIHTFVNILTILI